jgi:hypothetical protein
MNGIIAFGAAVVLAGLNTLQQIKSDGSNLRGEPPAGRQTNRTVLKDLSSASQPA